jgi:hypothetical protein
VSGLELEREFAQLFTLRRGLVAHEQFFIGWEKGLRAAGLAPDARAPQPSSPRLALRTRRARLASADVAYTTRAQSDSHLPRINDRE